MSQQIKAVRGMNDILPEQATTWRYLKQKIQEVVSSYGYREINTPIIEATELFNRGVGSGTDIIEKEMYSLLDRNNQSLSLRPEATAGIVRATIEKGMLYNQVQRLWTTGSMFRYERPQKGRYRQFFQTSIEAFGIEGAEIDAEIILLTYRLLKKLNLHQYARLELNNLGSTQDRFKYRQALIEYFAKYKNQLDEDSLRRLDINPLRILDSKNVKIQNLIADAPILKDYLCKESLEHFDKLQEILSEFNLPIKLNSKLVRGLDYYNLTVFEWVTDALGAQGTICAGGRYDGLVELLGGKSSPAFGCAMGLERIVLMLDDTQSISAKLAKYADISLVCADNNQKLQLVTHSELLRNELNDIKVHVNYCGSFKSQVKRSENTGARFIWVIDDKIDGNTMNIQIKCTATKTIKNFTNTEAAVSWLSEQFRSNL